MAPQMYGFSLHWNMCSKFNTIVEDHTQTVSWSLKHRAVFENTLTDYTRAYHGNFTGSQELNWSYFNSNKYKWTVKTQKMNQDEQVASHGCPWCRKVPTWFPHGSHILLRWFSNQNSQLITIPSAVLVWDKHSRAKYLGTLPPSDAPFGPRVGLESDELIWGWKKNTSWKKEWIGLITIYNIWKTIYGTIYHTGI